MTRTKSVQAVYEVCSSVRTCDVPWYDRAVLPETVVCLSANATAPALQSLLVGGECIVLRYNIPTNERQPKSSRGFGGTCVPVSTPE